MGASRSSRPKARERRSLSRYRCRDPRADRRRPLRRPRRAPAAAGGGARPGGRRRGGERARRRLRDPLLEARRDPAGRRDAGQVGHRGPAGGAARGARGEGARPLDAGRPALRARRVRGRRVGLRAEGGCRRRGRPGRARGRRRRTVRPSGARRAARARRRGGGAAGGGRPALGARARGAAPAGARAHQPGDREAALHLDAHGRDAPRAHHAEAAAREPGGARALRARQRAARRELIHAAGFPKRGSASGPMSLAAVGANLRSEENESPQGREQEMRKYFEIGGLVAAVVLIAFGVTALVIGVNGRSTVSSSLKQEQIYFGDAKVDPTVPKQYSGQLVDTGAKARAFANMMRGHTLEASHGLTYAQMGRFLAKPGTAAKLTDGQGGTNDAKVAVTDPKSGPVANPARNLWVTETALTTALNTSYMAERIALFGIVVGIALLLSGIGFAILAIGGALRNPETAIRFASKPTLAPTH